MKLSNGEAMVTAKPELVRKMPLTMTYNGDSNFMSSMTSPAELTKSSLKGTSMGMITSTGMSGMKI